MYLRTVSFVKGRYGEHALKGDGGDDGAHESLP